MRCIVKSYLVTQWMNTHSFFCLILSMYINGTYVHKELFISCNFKVGMIIKWAKFQKFKSESSIMSLSTLWFWTLKILLTWKISKRYFKTKLNNMYAIHRVLALSNQCECVATKISSITEKRQSRNGRIAW